MKKSILLFFAFLFAYLSLFAQDRQVRGKVVDENNNPLVGVSILISGRPTGVQTDASGNFTIAASGTGNIILVVSYSGFQSQTVTTDGSQPVNITLIKNVTILEDVVVVGYQTIRKKDLTGSVSSISARDIKDVPLSSAAEAIQGRLAGVQLTSTEGAPGADLIIRVRGGNSITQDNSPLYIVDGIQVDNALSVIAPQDIASIDVLKDASTTAIYGARGANGVVIITTKAEERARRRSVTMALLAGESYPGKWMY